MRSLLVLTLLPGLALAAEGRGSFDRTLKVAGTVDLEIETGSGAIEVRKGDSASVVIHATIHVNNHGTFRRDADEKVRQIEANPPIEQSGNTIHVGQILDRELRKNISIDYEVITPADSRLRANSGSGHVRVEDLKGSVDATTGSGGVTLARLGSEARARTGSGKIELDEITGRVDAHTGSGGIRGARISGSIIADTGSGSVELEQTNAASIEAHTGSGGVTIRVPSQAAFDLRAHTGSGSITVDHPMTVSGTIGHHDLQAKVRGGSSLVDVRTGSGSIRIE
jgi:DUF4097 and DUF4098 domain-containing protein YvlB